MERSLYYSARRICVSFARARVHRCFSTTTATRAVASAHAPQESATETGDRALNRIFLCNQHRPEEVELPEALRALRAYSLSEIPETVELSLRFNMTLKKNKVRDPFRGTLVYPHRFGEESTLLFFAEDVLADVAREAGADIVGGEEIIPQVEEGSLDFDLCLCTTAMFEKIQHLQNKLRAKMPSLRRGTVVDDIEEAINKFKHSREYKTDKHGYSNVAVAKLDFHDDHIRNNIQALVEAVCSHRNHLPKPTFIKRGVLSSTYGPGFLLNMTEFL